MTHPRIAHRMEAVQIESACRELDRVTRELLSQVRAVLYLASTVAGESAWAAAISHIDRCQRVLDANAPETQAGLDIRKYIVNSISDCDIMGVLEEIRLNFNEKNVINNERIAVVI